MEGKAAQYIRALGNLKSTLIVGKEAGTSGEGECCVLRTNIDRYRSHISAFRKPPALSISIFHLPSGRIPKTLPALGPCPPQESNPDFGRDIGNQVWTPMKNQPRPVPERGIHLLYRGKWGTWGGAGQIYFDLGIYLQQRQNSCAKLCVCVQKLEFVSAPHRGS